MSRVCAQCGENKQDVDFPITGKHVRKDGTVTTLYKPQCKLCFNDLLKREFRDKINACGVDWKCARCGYDKCIAALDLHHLDPSKKEFAISSRWSISLDRLRQEAEKCMVLCANCHRELHAGEWAVS